MKEPVFRTLATAIVTPFSGDSIDFRAYDALLTCQLDAGVPAIVVTGTTGEASTLTAQEKRQLWQHSADFLRGRSTLIAGIGTNCTATSVALAKAAADSGAQALLAVTPYYNKCTQDGLVRHYHAIAEATTLPLILYDVPSRTGVHILPETCARLAAHPRINGIKYAGSSMVTAAEIRQLCGDALHLWSGNDDQCVAAMAIGAAGLISVVSNLLPRETLALCRLCEAGNYPAAAAEQARLLPLIGALFAQPNPIPVKAALEAMGQCSGALRLPLSPLSDAQREPLLQRLRELHCIPPAC